MKRWFKKRFYLPIKYWRTRRHIIKNCRLRSPEEIMKLKGILENDLHMAKRNSYENGIAIITAKKDVLDWLTYDNNKAQNYYKDNPTR